MMKEWEDFEILFYVSKYAGCWGDWEREIEKLEIGFFRNFGGIFFEKNENFLRKMHFLFGTFGSFCILGEGMGLEVKKL